MAINIIDFIPFGQDRAITYNQLRRLTGLSKRLIRRDISQARKEHIILNMQDGNGFFQPLEDEEYLIERFYNQENHRNNEHRETLKPLQDYLYMRGIV